MRMLISKILNNLLELFPTSRTGLNAFRDSLEFFSELISKFEDAANITMEYEDFESSIIELIESKIKSICKNEQNPNVLMYFLECISDKKFHGLIC